MPQKHILATSGGYKWGYQRPTLGPIIQYGLKLTGKENPKLCYIGTAGGDASNWIAAFYTACIGHNVQPSHLELFPLPNVDDVKSFLLGQDIIWVGGGSVANLLAVWRVHGLDKVLRQAWEQGIVLAGQSAGSICWHVGGTTDSFGENLHPVTNGLGFLPYGNGVHYDAHPQRRTLLQELVAEAALPESYATDDGVALHYIDESFNKAVADTPNKFAYHIRKTDAGVEETKIEAELLAS